MSLLLLTYGPTHSGKTTFGRRVKEALGESAKFIHVDNDVVDQFVKENYNNLRTDTDILATRTPTNPDLRLLIPQLIAGYALKERYSVIATAAHPKPAIRQSYYDIATQNSAKVVLLMFRISDAAAMVRIDGADRDKGILDISPHGGANFKELYAKQKNILEEPTEEEKATCYKVFEITEENYEAVLDQVVDIVKQPVENITVTEENQ